MISRSVFIRAKCRAEATVSYLPSDTCRAEIYRRQHNSCWSRRTLAISPADHPAGKLLSPDRPEHRRRSQCTQWDRCTVDRKSTRLNSSHEWISYAVFCLKKKKKPITKAQSRSLKQAKTT